MSRTLDNTSTPSRSLGFPFRARTTSSTTTEPLTSHKPRKLNSLFQFNHTKVNDNNNNQSRQPHTPGLEQSNRYRGYSDDDYDNDNYSDNGTVQPGEGQYTLRVINPDPASSSSEDEDDDHQHPPTKTSPTPLSHAAATTTSVTAKPPSPRQLPSRQFDVAPVEEETPPHVFVTSFVTTAPSPTASSLSLGSSTHNPGAVPGRRESPPPSQALEPPPPGPAQPSSLKTIVRRESKTLHESPSSGSLLADFLPPLDLSPFDLNAFTPGNTRTVPRVVLGPKDDQIPEEDEEKDDEKEEEKNVNLILDEALVDTPLTLTPEATRTNSLLQVPRNNSIQGSINPPDHSPPLTFIPTGELIRTQRPLTPSDSGIVSSSLYGNRSTGSTMTTESVLTSAMRPSNSKYAKASYSLTNKRDALKLYRDMAEKTNDPQIQLAYAKYLLEIAPLYVSSRNTTRHGHTKYSSLSIMGNDMDKLVKRGRARLNSTAARLATVSSSSSSSSTAMNQDEKRQALEEEGVRWVRRLAKEGNGEAAGMLATWIDEQKYGLKLNPAKSLGLHEIAARQGRPESIFAVGQHHERQGQDAAALKCYKDASELGLVAAVQRLALVMIHGQLGQRQNMTTGLDLLAQAAANATRENPDPLFVFAQVLSNTYPRADIPSELVQTHGGKDAAFPAFERAAELGHTGALAELGNIHKHGLYGVPINIKKSFNYYDKAAKKGDPDAMLGLSSLYNGGIQGPDDSIGEQQNLMERDVSHWLEQNPRNEDLSFHWCQKAADQHHPNALFLLGWYYETGFGTPRDYGRAYALYERAANKGHEEAAQRLQKETKVRHPAVDQPVNHRRVSLDSRRESQACVIM